MAAVGFNPQDPIEDRGSLILLVPWVAEEAVGGVGVCPQELASLVGQGQGALILPVPVRAEEAEAMAAVGFNPQDPIEDKGALILLVPWGAEEAVGGVGVCPQELASLVGQGQSALMFPISIWAGEAEAMAARGVDP